MKYDVTIVNRSNSESSVIGVERKTENDVTPWPLIKLNGIRPGKPMEATEFFADQSLSIRVFEISP